MKFEKHEINIKNKMSSFEPEVDTEGLWSSLESFVPKKKRKSPGLYITLITGIFILISSLVFFINQGNNNNENKHLAKKISVKKDSIETNIWVPDIENIKKFQLSSLKSSVNKNDNQVDQTAYQNSKKYVEKKSCHYKNSKAKSRLFIYEPDDKKHEKNPKKSKQESKKRKINSQNKNDALKRKIIACSHLFSLKQIADTRSEELSWHFDDILIFHKKIQSKVFLINYGIGLGYLDFSTIGLNKKSGEYSKYLNSIVDTKPALMINSGLEYLFSKSYYFKAGLEFQRTVMAYHPVWKKRIVEDRKIENGLIQRVMLEKKYNAIGHNYQNALDISFDLGMIIYRFRKIDIALEIGLSSNILRYSHGKILNEELKLKSYSSGLANIYSKYYSTGFHSSMVLNFAIPNNLVWYMQPGFFYKNIRYRLGDIAMKERYKMFIFIIGVKHKIY